MLYRLAPLVLVIVLFFTGCQTAPGKTTPALTIYTTLYPLKYFTERIGGKHVEVNSIVPADVDPHDFELTPGDLVKLNKANLVICNGSNFEPWLTKIKENISTKIVNSSESVPKASLLLVDHHHDHEHDHQHQHDHDQVDPHLWLDPRLAKEQAAAISQALVKADPQHTDEYKSNLALLTKDLDALDKEFEQSLSKAKERRIVVSHAAFGYLAKRYNLTQIPIAGLSHTYEPSPRDLKAIVDQIRKYKLKYIFIENNNSRSKLTEALRREVGAEVLILSPLEILTKEERDNNEDYLSIMKRNKRSIMQALGVS